MIFLKYLSKRGGGEEINILVVHSYSAIEWNELLINTT